MNDFGRMDRRLFLRQPWYERLRRWWRAHSFGWIK
jgi:hypothetical protein